MTANLSAARVPWSEAKAAMKSRVVLSTAFAKLNSRRSDSQPFSWCKVMSMYSGDLYYF